MTITEFLLARIAEDEEAARAVRPLDHNYDMGGGRQDERFVFTRYLPDSMDGRGNWAKDDPATSVHFARHDPARVLAECEAKRKIVEQARAYSPASEYGDGEGWALVDVMRALASVYADHPDYDQDWRA
ncbi:MAG TPA: DUF6221 family protein [Aeromicrobium sp.]|nr:DUF6221 family protein [Aeromicrobium sp.]HKY59267.1 DUF6221 family protein [Aeromicrobium sp.]